MNIEIAPKEYEIELNWHDAKLYCEFLDINGKTDWRMPTFDELCDILSPHDNVYDVKDYTLPLYWSSTDWNDNDTYAYGALVTEDGKINGGRLGHDGITERYTIIPVRDL